MILYYVRHGDPIYDPDSLTDLGHKQAKALAKRFALYGLDKVYSSPSVRAKQTAQPTCDLLGLTMSICDWADEGRAWADTTVIKKDGSVAWLFHDQDTLTRFHEPSVRALGNEWYKHPHFAKRSYEAGMNRMNLAIDEFMQTLGFLHDREQNCYRKINTAPKRVALFAHQGAGMMILSSLLDIPYPMFCSCFDFGHSSVTVIHFDEKNEHIYPKVFQLSNDSHLYKEGILTGYNNEMDI